MSYTLRVTKSKQFKLSNPILFISVCLVLVSIYINPSVADPFNSPKLWLLMILGGWVLGYLVSYRYLYRTAKYPEQRISIMLLLTFLVFLFISSSVTGLSYTAIFGEQQRRLGLLFYVFMVIFSLASVLYCKEKNLKQIVYAAWILSAIFSIYGLMQYTGRDFINWNNPYNPIILTLGNPNYASALMSMLSIITLTSVQMVNFRIKLVLVSLTFFQIFLIVLSNSRQGIIAFIIGISVVILTYFYVKSIKLFRIMLTFFIAIFILIILAMIQIGPLVKFVYKDSVSIRGYYWRAAIKMFESNIFFGVGTDNYGRYFRQFREKEYPITYGNLITSDNAHNVPLQIFSTSGIFVGILYLLIVMFIFLCGLNNIKKMKSQINFFYVAIFGSWIAYQAQSFISIENIGLSIWGWVMAGVIIGAGKFDSLSTGADLLIQKLSLQKLHNIATVQKINSTFFSCLFLILSALLYQGEKTLYTLSVMASDKSIIQTDAFSSTLSKFDNSILVEPGYKFSVANLLLQLGNIDESKKRIDFLIAKNPNVYNYLALSAQLSESESDWSRVIATRIKIEELDPWNTDNLLSLARTYEILKFEDKALHYYKKILFFAPTSKQGIAAKQAIIEIQQQ